MSVALLATFALGACAVGPDYRQPPLSEADRFAADAGLPPVAAAESEFWRGFGDPLLSRLVDDALIANHDLRIALARYDQANALLRETKFDRLPTVTARAGASGVRSSASERPGELREQRDVEIYQAGIDAAWELDFFGRVRRSIEAERAGVEASAADLGALQVDIVAEVASSYFELRGLQVRLRVARSNADNQLGTLELVETRVGAGRGTAFDSERARAQHETTLARIPALESAILITMHRLAVLTGTEPQALIAELDVVQPLPAVPPRIAAGAPGDLLRRRPDVAAAERRLAAATARVGVAAADLFPRFTLGGLIGSHAIDADALFERDSETRVVALGVDWSFLDVGRVRARIAAAEAAAAGNLAAYEQAVLRALEETESALVRYARAQREDEHLRRAADSSAQAAELARVRFDGGVIDLLEVLDAERTRLEAEDELAQSRTRTATALVTLYKSLAGGWPQRMPTREGFAAS